MWLAYVLSCCVSVLLFFVFSVSSFLFFFFQAEDGIRDGHVTGVQTCALPIFYRNLRIYEAQALYQSGERGVCPGYRSEERRVGKECRSRWSACHEKKKE